MDTLERATVSRVGGKLGPASTDVAPPGNREPFESFLLLRHDLLPADSKDLGPTLKEKGPPLPSFQQRFPRTPGIQSSEAAEQTPSFSLLLKFMNADRKLRILPALSLSLRLVRGDGSGKAAFAAYKKL